MHIESKKILKNEYFDDPKFLLFTNFSKLALLKMDISFFVAMIIIMLEYLPTLPLLRPLGAKNALDYILGA